jgi:Tol biopolymer transport system component
MGLRRPLLPSVIALCGLCPFGIAEATRVVYLAEQDTAYVLELYVVDTDRAGQPVKLNRPLTRLNDGVIDFEVSPDGRHVVYAADEDTAGMSDLYLVSLAEPRTRVRLGTLTNRRELHARFSPDGKKVAFTASDRNYGDVQLYYVRVARPDVARRVSSAGGSVSQIGFQFTADSRGLVFAQDLDRPGVKELYLVWLSERKTKIKLNPPFTSFGNVGDSFEARFALTPDGRSVVYSAAQEIAGMRELFAVELSNPGVSTRLNGPFQSNGYLFDFALSPDGRRVAYSADEDTDALNELYVVELSSPGLATRINRPVTAGVARFRFTPNSRGVVFSADSQRPGLLDLYLWTRGSGKTRRLNKSLSGRSEVTNFAVSHDGARVVYYTNPPKSFYERRVLVVDVKQPRVSATLVEKLTKGGLDGGAARPVFTSDDRSIVFMAGVGSTWELYATELANPFSAVRLNAPLPPDGMVMPATYKNSFVVIDDDGQGASLETAD